MKPLSHASLLFFLCIVTTSWAATPYEPIRPSPLSESWRWHAQEALERLTLTDCFEGEDGSLWFVSDTGLVHYDGVEVNHFPAPEELNLVAYRSGARTSDGSIYLLMPRTVARFKAGRFQVIHTFAGNYDMLSGHAVLVDEDTVLFGTPEGIVSISDGQAEVISTMNRRASFLLLDSRGDLWMNRVGSGLLYRYRGFTPDTKLDDSRWDRYRVMPNSSAHITLTELHDGRIWCANDSPDYGILEFNPEDEKWSPVGIDDQSVDLVHRRVHVTPDGTVLIYGDKRIILWKNGRRQELTIKEFDFPITSPFARSLSNGSMIIGGRRESIYLVDCSTRSWDSFEDLNYYCNDMDGRRWFIAFDGYIVSWDVLEDKWVNYHDEKGIINTPLAMISTRNGDIVVAGSHDNVAAFSVLSNGTWSIHIHPEMGMRISHQSLIELTDGSLLMGSGDADPEFLPGIGGLLFYKSTGSGAEVVHISPPRVPHRVVGIQEAPDGTIWMGGNRLRRLDGKIAFELESLGDFRNSWIDSFIITEAGDQWIAQWGIGIHLWNKDGWHHSAILEQSLPTSVVSLMQDSVNPGQIWAATSVGLFNLDLQSWVNEPLNRELGILREGGELYQSPDGTVWLNESSRNWHFRPTGSMPGSERFRRSFRTTAFKRYDVVPDTRIVEYEAKVYEPGLSYFKWTGNCRWSISQAENLSYSYRINSGDWTPFSKRTEVVLQTHENGLHTFEVRARTPYGLIDTTPASVQFEVIPVLWKQPWFILLMSAIAILLILLIVIIVRQRIHHYLAIEEYKIQFFTNISHELRSPLMVILGPLEKLLKQVDEKGRQQVEIAYRNAQKLVGLLDRLLDFRKAQLGKLQANPQNLDLVSFIRQEMESLRPLADKKGQVLDFTPDRGSMMASFDPKFVEIILDNLLTNAIKYTPRGGAVHIFLKVDWETPADFLVHILVEDSGPGIAQGNLENVFNPFFQEVRSGELKSHSTGIGLAHTKSLIEAMGGGIRAESPVNKNAKTDKGTRFTVELVLPKASGIQSLLPADVTSLEDEFDSDEEAFSTEQKPLMLIVEDDDDIREFLTLEFCETYTVIQAMNGQEGLDLAFEHIPDIVISDVMMPVKDGRELCRELKSDQRTSHIPVILLTSLKSETNEIAGLETGADDYITKPVNITLLHKRVENIFQSRVKIREFIKSKTRSISISKDELPVNKVDQEFMTKLMDTVENNLTSETFDVEDLAKQMFMSRMTLYRKVKALTGQSPGGIIRTFRLKKAAQYLETGSWKVSQVIERVGFLDMSHFSRSFKKEYGCTPTEYIERFHSGSEASQDD